MDLAALQKILSALSGARIACVGDLMVDRFVYGDVTRVSPEARSFRMAIFTWVPA